MEFNYFSPTRLVVGRGSCTHVSELAKEQGKHVFLITGPNLMESRTVQPVLDSLNKKGLKITEYIKPAGEPSVTMVDDATLTARNAGCDVVVSVGGGSCIDLAKAIAGLVTNGGPITDYLEGVGIGKSAKKTALPHIAIPTTAGAGAEMTRNAVICSKEERFKKSFRSPTLYPVAAILDAELTANLPPEQTAYSGMDAITQLIESYITRKANPITDALALRGLQLAFGAIRDVFHHGDNIEKRQDMLLASSLSGICLANAGLGLAHGFASGLGAVCDVPHGKVCAIMLPHAIKFNHCAALDKLANLGRLVCDEPNLKKGEYADRLLETVIGLNREFGIPLDLKSLTIPDEDHLLIARMSMGNSMSGNPVEVVPAIAQTILEALT